LLLMSKPAQLVIIVISSSLQIQVEPPLQHARYFLPFMIAGRYKFGLAFSLGTGSRPKATGTPI